MYKKVPYAQAVERTRRRHMGIQEGRQTSQEQAGGEGVQQRNGSSNVRSDAFVRSIEGVDGEARSTRARTNGYEDCARATTTVQS